MWLERVRRYILPGSIEQDPGFREEVIRLSHLGLQVVGALAIIVQLFMTAAFQLLQPDPELSPLRIWEATSVCLLGVTALSLARVRSLRPYSRTIALSVVLAAAALSIAFLLAASVYDPTADEFVPGQVTLITLVAVAAIPMRPTDNLLFGFLLEATYIAIAVGAQRIWGIGAGVEPIYVLYIFMLTCLAATLTAVLYDHRRSTYEWHLSTLRAAEDLRQAEARNLLSENAASVGRLAAALSHELNSPIGALVSGVDTLLLLTSKQATSAPEDQQRLVRLQNDLRRSIRESTERLKQLVQRMQRFTNLDKAEVQSADVNEIISDVAALLEPRSKGKATVDLLLQPVPRLVCHPQQLSAVFSNLIGNAIDAVNGDGRIKVTTRHADPWIEVAVEDNGKGLSPSDIETIFDPGFKVSRGRVAAGNWSMFSSRQIVREHGGEIDIESQVGKGTSVRVKLPCEGDESGLRLT